jgi:hypothetical protein
MQRQIIIRVGVACGALLFALTSFAYAQNPPARQSYQVTIVQVKPEMEREYGDYLKNEAIPALQKSGVKQRAAWRTATFGEGGEYVFLTPIESLAQFDNPNAMVKALGQEGVAALLAKRARLISSSRNVLITARPDLGVAPKADYAYKLGFSGNVTVTPGRTAEYEKYVKDLSATVAKTNAKGVLVGKAGLGGDPNSYRLMVLFDNWADLEKFQAAYAKASAETKLTPAAAGVVAHTEWRVYRYAPELSITPTPQRAAK